jgi:raffinose/stachyose/melibiose transport system permease protein
MKTKRNWFVTILLMVETLLIFFPLFLTITVALKTPKEMAGSLLSLPKEWRFQNFLDAIELTNFFQALSNSFIVTFFVVVLTVLTNSLVSYAIARNMHKRFFRGLFYYFVSAMFVPFPIIMLPLVRQTALLGMDNLVGLIFLYIVFQLSFNVFIYVGYIKSIPVALEEAAVMDGANSWRIFWKVIFPLLTPMNATVAILTTLYAWNDFMLPPVILTDSENATLPLVQYIFQTEFSTNYNLAFASYLLALLPMVIVYLIAQRWIISNVTRGEVK